jgi:hypothetical protein
LTRASSDCNPVGTLPAEQASAKHQVARRWGNVAASIWRKTKGTRGIADVVHGSNKTFSSACCEAKPGYDMASGWGLLVPDHLQRIVALQSRPAH